MESHRREKAKNTAGHAFGDMCERVFGRRVMANGDVNSTCLPEYLTLSDEACEARTRDAVSLKVTRAHESHLFDPIENVVLAAR